MKNFKSLLALTLALLMLFAFIACETGDDNKKDPGTPTGAVPTGPDEPEDLTEGGKWMDYRGANGNNSWKLPALTFPSNKVTILNHSELQQPDPLFFNAFRDVYKLVYETVVVANENKVSKFISMIMSDESPDVFMSGFTPALANKNYAAPWDDYIDFSIGIWDDMQRSLDNVSMNGKHYFIDAWQTRHGNLVWVNTEIFTDLDVKSPVEYYDEGNWTWETFRECALATTIDVDSDGVPDVWGFSTDVPNAFLLTTGVDFVTYNPDGTATNNVRSDKVSRGVNFYVELFDLNVVYEGSDNKDMFAAGSIAMFMGPLWYRGFFRDIVHAGKVDIVPWPKDPAADRYYISEEYGGHILGSGCANPQGAAAYMNAARYNALNTEDREELPNDERYEKSMETIEISNKIQAVMFSEDKYPVLVTWGAFEVHQYWGDIWFYTRLGEPWATTAEQIAPKMDADIQRILEG